jgi:cobalt-zinc-cadmium efflux system outer membrane protein
MRLINTGLMLALLVVLGACHGGTLAGGGAAIDAELRSRSGLGPAAGRMRIEALLADGLSLDDALRIALVRNAKLLASYEDLDIAYADLLQAGLPDNPSFDGSARFLEDGGGTIIEAAVVQPLMTLLLAPQRRRIAQAEACAVRARLMADALRVLGHVRKAWYGLVAAEQSVELRQTSTLAARAAHEAAAELRRAGNITALDAIREQAFYEEERASVADAQLQAYTSREKLNQLLGLGGDLTRWTITNRLPELPDRVAALADIESQALCRSQDLAHERARLVALGQSLGLAVTESTVREVAIGATGEREAGGEWSIGPVIQLEIPIFDYGQASVPRARARVRQAMLTYVALAVQVRTQARVARESLRAAWRQARHARGVLVPLRQQVLDEMLKQSNAMQVGVFHVLQAKRELISTGEHYVKTLQQYWVERARVDQVLAGALPDRESKMGD